MITRNYGQNFSHFLINLHINLKYFLKGKAGYRRASFLWHVFMWQVLSAKCKCVYATNFIWQVSFTGVNVSTSLEITIVRWPITSHAQITLTFSLLTHTEEQNLYFDNFFYDKCTCSKASKCTCHRKNCQSCAYRRANKTYRKLARL